MVSFYSCDAAREAGSTVVSGVPVAGNMPAEYVVPVGGERIAACTIVSNADTRQALTLLGVAANPAWQSQVERVPIEGCTVKLNVHLSELPKFTVRPSTDQPHHYGHIFQGECLPLYMWAGRCSERAPKPGVYLCGAWTYPGDSVIGIDDRNAAMEVLKDLAII